MHVQVLFGLLLCWNNIILYLYSIKRFKGLYVYNYVDSPEVIRSLFTFSFKKVCERLASKWVKEQNLDPHSFLS